ncbi:MAG: hypothetical protein VXU42_03785, partial [Verrucomicrobiota bacterium]|nr:hypothetical protein [Verrucomicrobiota bacterium]
LINQQHREKKKEDQVSQSKHALLLKGEKSTWPREDCALPDSDFEPPARPARRRNFYMLVTSTEMQDPH